MAVFKHILAATDFGPSSLHSVDLALDLAVLCEAELSIVHVLEMPFFPTEVPINVQQVFDDLESVASDDLDRILAPRRERWARTSGALVRGIPWMAILSEAQARNADLLVVGTHGRRGLPHALLGSVAEKIVRLATVPVLTIRNAR